MDTFEILDYIDENFNVAVEARRLIENILIYADIFCAEDEEFDFLCKMLEGTIGLTREEIRSFCQGGK